MILFSISENGQERQQHKTGRLDEPNVWAFEKINEKKNIKKNSKSFHNEKVKAALNRIFTSNGKSHSG